MRLGEVTTSEESQVAEVQERVGKLKNGKAFGRDEITGDDKRWR